MEDHTSKQTLFLIELYELKAKKKIISEENV